MVTEPAVLLPKWQRIRDMEQARPTFVPCAAAAVTAEEQARDADQPAGMPASKAVQWAELRRRLCGLPAMDMLEPVSEFFNEWPYITDQKLHGVKDHWAAPFEFMAGGGDCEDYAIAKYYALRGLGVPAGQMRIAAVWNQRQRDGHAVLLVRCGDVFLSLDCLTDAIRPLERMTHYIPQFFVNEEHLWLRNDAPAS